MPLRELPTRLLADEVVGLPVVGSGVAPCDLFWETDARFSPGVLCAPRAADGARRADVRANAGIPATPLPGGLPYGIRQESEVTWPSGFPVYFMIFFPDPVPGQTIRDVVAARPRFVEEVAARHPDSPESGRSGNCPGGWSVMRLAPRPRRMARPGQRAAPGPAFRRARRLGLDSRWPWASELPGSSRCGGSKRDGVQR